MLTLRRNQRLLALTALLVLSSASGCAVRVSDFESCALIPGRNGAVCSHFLVNQTTVLNESSWEQKKAQWNASGQAVECMGSNSIGDFKREIEELCSREKCSYETKQQIEQGLDRLERAATAASRAGGAR